MNRLSPAGTAPASAPSPHPAPSASLRGVFITGTGTDVGKTYVAALLLRRLREAGVDAGYFKAALSGAEEEGGRLVPGDAARVYRIAGIPGDPGDNVPYCYRTAASPHLAARLEGPPMDPAVVETAYRRAAARHAFLVAEGSGGIVCPLRAEDDTPYLLTDVIRMTGLPLLIVSAAGLGAINAAVLTAAYAREQGLPVTGFVLNGFLPGDPLHEDNRVMIERLTGVPVLAALDEGARSIDFPLERLLRI